MSRVFHSLCLSVSWSLPLRSWKRWEGRACCFLICTPVSVTSVGSHHIFSESGLFLYSLCDLEWQLTSLVKLPPSSLSILMSGNSNLYLQVKIYFHLLIKYHYQYHKVIILIHVHVLILLSWTPRKTMKSIPITCSLFTNKRIMFLLGVGFI